MSIYFAKKTKNKKNKKIFVKYNSTIQRSLYIRSIIIDNIKYNRYR